MLRWTLQRGDCRTLMAEMPAGSVDSIVTDPPYGLSFMGKGWDHGVPGVEFWAEALRVTKPGAHLLAFGGTRTYHRLACAIEDAGWEVRDCLGWLYGSGFPKSHNLQGEWQGWGTALKPAWEPIILARKPFPGTVAANVLEHGTGALNVDGCRVEDKRWPANLIHDGSDEVVGLFPDTTSGSRKAGRHVVAGGQGRYGEFAEGDLPEVIGDSGSAARFFYCAKASKRDRDEGCDSNHHPTVKPTDLMRYLCRLVTPPGGLVLDPFGGSGSTGKAALLEGFRVTLCELSEEYWPIIEARCKWAASERPEGKVSAAPVQRTLFSGD